jgi:hypothetical protein
MRPVKTKPRFRCEYCRFTATEPTVVKHEKICWRNPNRYCESCKNKGYYYEEYDEGLGENIPCYYCSQYKPLDVA